MRDKGGHIVGDEMHFLIIRKTSEDKKQLTNLGMQLITIQRRWPWKIYIQRYDWLVGWIYDMSICVGLFNVEFYMEHPVGTELPIQ